MKESVQDWIKKKGGNIEPLVEQVKSMKEESEKRVEEKRAETDCYFYLRKVSL